MDREETELLLDAARRWFREFTPMDARVASFRDGQHEHDGAWRNLAELGWLGLTLPEDDGGVGADYRVAFELLRVAGRDARPESLDLHLLLAPLRLSWAAGEERSRIAAALSDGSMRLALSDLAVGDDAVRVDADGRLQGSAGTVLGAGYATHLLVPVVEQNGGSRLAEIELASAAGIERVNARLVDGRSTALFRLTQTTALLFDKLPGAGHVMSARNRVAAALIADSAGVLEAAFELTLDYLKQRVQFGKPLAAQQAVQHKMAEIFCDLQQLIALSRRVAAEMDLAPDGPWHTLRPAKAFIGRRALRACGQLIQVSGGIGVTEEYRLTHYYRRLHVAATLFGNAEEQLESIDVRAVLLAH
ncbi:acyl-CoA dehydrogenase family protein [Paraburkholderia sp. BCC1886]|uniref:acyl-CoA dehydrogenase family protein n=1 Tax=Paraburkholderia sp. BCC1886 TaxID=2562670 RepID=UPI0011827F66|nr:acyl-CoA dehydrogenase family protein [Paraburkholderia sp. BCC1886]